MLTRHARGLVVARERAVLGRRAGGRAGRGEREIGCVARICIGGAFEPGKQAETAIWRAEKSLKCDTLRHFATWVRAGEKSKK
jgi:hypothetical protein